MMALQERPSGTELSKGDDNDENNNNNDNKINDSIPITRPKCSARTVDGGPCDREPEIACPKCILVAYCGAECRKSHWATHRLECGTVPSAFYAPVEWNNAKWEDPGYWARHAATDVLNLQKNEGKEFAGDLDILLLGESSLRHLIYSVVKLPKTTTPTINATLNETSHQHLARLILTVLLLTDDSSDPITNVEAAVHLWYSTKLPAALLRHIEVTAANPLLTAMNDLSLLHAQGRIADQDAFPITISRGPRTVVIDINIHQWQHTVGYLKASSMSAQYADLHRVIDSKKHAPPVERILKRMSPSRIAGFLRWRADGLLLPYGHPRDEFDTYNPLYFNDTQGYPVGASGEPLAEWPIELLDYPCGHTQNDVYGKMFYFVRDMCLDFQKRIKTLGMEIRITSQHLSGLPAHLTSGNTQAKRFDRIEAAHYWDHRPFLTMVSMTNLLRHQQENPHATLLTITGESVADGMNGVDGGFQSVQRSVCEESNTALDEYAPPLDENEDMYTAAAVRRGVGVLMWRNWDKISEHYLTVPHFFDDFNRIALAKQPDLDVTPSEKGLTATFFLGMALKTKNTVTRRWPNRLVHSKKDAPGLRNFNRWVGWVHNLPQRWLEWKKIRDISQEDWDHYYNLAIIETQMRESMRQGRRIEHDKIIREMMKLKLVDPEAEPGEAANLPEKSSNEVDGVNAEVEVEEQDKPTDVTLGQDEEESTEPLKPKVKNKKKSKKKKM